MEDDKNIIKEVKILIDKEIELFKVNLVEKISKIITTLFVGLIAVFLVMIAFIYFSFAIAEAIKPLFSQNNTFVAYLIIGGIFVILLILLVVFNKKKLILNKFVRKFTAIIFDTNSTDKKSKNINSTH
ncbi:MAG: phage holin family protein [Bacteroidales bacterium]|jgi:uncharacterized membrane protein YqjE